MDGEIIGTDILEARNEFHTYVKLKLHGVTGMTNHCASGILSTVVGQTDSVLAGHGTT